MMIWVIPIQKEIAAKVQESFSLKAEIERLLYVTKGAVEIAIEQSEAEALVYLINIISIQGS